MTLGPRGLWGPQWPQPNPDDPDEPFDYELTDDWCFIPQSVLAVGLCVRCSGSRVADPPAESRGRAVMTMSSVPLETCFLLPLLSIAVHDGGKTASLVISQTVSPSAGEKMQRRPQRLQQHTEKNR
ncbi:hypothetical protein QQF64_009076 [Cirrhinus molitorella]|uniref:Uncharacterized protein n=1 Tax=Cirrhinus molitorella TaxID=172907 RepID=A0ABR3M057_9TELE